jgi:hypothetical protein
MNEIEAAMQEELSTTKVNATHPGTVSAKGTF